MSYGMLVDSTYVLKANNFYLVSIAPLSAQDISSVGVDRADQAGGDRFGECIAFTDYLPAKERAYLQSKLMHKWLGAAEAVWTNSIASVNLAAGSSLIVEGGVIEVSTITGGGAIEAERLVGVSSINLSTQDRDAVEGVTINSTVSFAETVTVSLVGPGAAKLKRGKYALVSATSIDNLDLSKWVVSPAQKNPCRFIREGNVIYLDIQAHGLTLVVR